MPEINILVKAKDEVSNVLERIGEKFAGLDADTVKLMMGGAVAIGAVGGAITKLAWDAAQVEPVRMTFDDLAEQIGETADSLLFELRPAAMGTMTDLDLMRSTNKLMMMGLADTAEEASELTRLAIGLGTAMGVDAKTGLENFTLMLANQSILRMDMFGLSSGRAREEINKLVDEGLSREEAFKLVVLDQGNEKLRNLGDLSDTAFVKLGNMQAGMGNVGDEVGEALLPVLNEVLDEALVPIAAKLIELAPLLEETLPAAIGPAVDALIALSGALEPILSGLQWIDDHRGAIDQIGRLAGFMADIGVPFMMLPEMLQKREITLPGGMSLEEFWGRGAESGAQFREQFLGGGGGQATINVYGVPGVAEYLRDVEGHTVAP